MGKENESKMEIDERVVKLFDAATGSNSAAIKKTRLGEIDMDQLEKAILIANGFGPDEYLTDWDELFIAGTRAYVNYVMSDDAAGIFRKAWEASAGANAFWDYLTPQGKADALAELEASHFSSDFLSGEKDFIGRMRENIGKASRSSLFGAHAEA